MWTPIVLGNKESHSKDVLGRIYEYFLGMFADAEGKRGGQFYTPRSIVRVLVEVLEPYRGIRVFLDRIEFMNPGPLPKDLDSIMKEDFTMPRNLTIVRIFRAIKLSENAGSGFDKMFTGWKAHYGMETMVTGGIDFYKIEFPLKKEAEKETTQKEPETGEKTGEKIISLIKENPEITTLELTEKLNISAKGVEWQIKNLEEQGFLKRIGPDKGATGK